MPVALHVLFIIFLNVILLITSTSTCLKSYLKFTTHITSVYIKLNQIITFSNAKFWADILNKNIGTAYAINSGSTLMKFFIVDIDLFQISDLYSIIVYYFIHRSSGYNKWDRLYDCTIIKISNDNKIR